MSALLQARNFMLLGFILTGLSGCSTGVSSSSTPAPKNTADATQSTPRGKCLNIVGGTPDTGYNAVHVLLLVDPTTGNVSSSCVGTFISDNTMITAGHCIPAAGEKYLLATTNAGQLQKTAKPAAGAIAAKQIFVDSRLTTNSGGGRDVPHDQSLAMDVAVVLFPDNTSKEWLPLASANVPAGTPVRLVGYGVDNALYPQKDAMPSVLIKRTGTNQIAPTDLLKANMNVEGQYFTFAWGQPGEAAAHGVSTVSGAPGDSGGPLLAGSTVIGVVSRGLTSVDTPDLEKNIGTNTLDIFVDVSNSIAQSLLQKAKAAGAHITLAPPSAGSAQPDTTATQSSSIQTAQPQSTATGGACAP